MIQGTKITAKKKREFLAVLLERGNVSAAARAVAVSKSTLYEHRKADPQFAAAWDDVKEEFLDGLEEEAARRAKEGVEEPVYQGGKLVGHVVKRSDVLLMFLLKGGRPEKFRERHEFTGAEGSPLMQPIADAILKIYGDDASDSQSTSTNGDSAID